jgi:hypothetical protein
MQNLNCLQSEGAYQILGTDHFETKETNDLNVRNKESTMYVTNS